VKNWLSLLTITLLAACGETEPRSLDEALSAYHQGRVKEAEAAFQRLSADPATPAGDKARALRETARIAWLIDGDAPRALKAVAAADGTGESLCENGRLRARVLEESGRGDLLLAEADAVAGRCTQPGRADPVRLAAARGALDRSDPLAARKQIGALSEDGRTSLGGAAARLDLALAERNPEEALQAWRDYFWLEGEDLPPALRGRAAPAAAAFGDALAAAAGVEAKLRLLDVLVKGGFAKAAQRFAAAERVAETAKGHAWTRISTYLSVRAELESALTAAYRGEARGRSPGDLDALVDKAAARLAAAAGRKGERADVLRDAYNLYGYVGDTGGHPGIHYGHLVEDDRRRVSQYGHSADAAFRVVDNMISNGFETWLWDGTAATGGWTEVGPVVVQVRPEYTSSPLGGWKLFSGAEERRELLAKQGESMAADVAALKAGAGVAYLPGLADRLRLQVADQIGARARARAAAGGGDLQRAYLEEHWRAMFQDGMLIHEGRHAIDKGLLWWWERLDDEELEFRAKVAELALADYPRLALINIDDATMGGDSAHGTANVRVMRALAEWIAAHSREVRGFDPKLPPMVQIDRLSDAQIRAIGRALDPLAPR
jgi:hypothetical protein